MNDICVLMSTYNGVKYIREQIDSILRQENVKTTIFIRDDGSSDGTTQVLEEYDDKYSNVTYINRGVRDNKGFNKSFLELLKYGLVNSEYEYFAFADQDDIWLECKLNNAMELIEKEVRKANSNLPIMYYSNKKWVDTNLNFLHEDDMRYCKGNYFDMFMLPPVYGCTTVFNRVLGEMTLAKEMPADLLYDVYMYRLACLVGGITIADKRVNMLYRRHGGNASGDAMKLSPLKHIGKYLINSSNFHGIQNYVRAIDCNFNGSIGEEQRELVSLILEYDKSLVKSIRLLLWPRAYERGLKAAIVWIGRVVLKAI